MIFHIVARSSTFLRSEARRANYQAASPHILLCLGREPSTGVKSLSWQASSLSSHSSLIKRDRSHRSIIEEQVLSTEKRWGAGAYTDLVGL